jgi:hypothetical protein
VKLRISVTHTIITNLMAMIIFMRWLPFCPK